MIDLIRPHLPADVTLEGTKTANGWFLTATRAGKLPSNAFIQDGQPVNHRQAALNLAYWL